MLLEGPWGSGKSHFVETYFRDRLEEARKRDAEAKDPLIHVSLFGVRELSDITTQMVEKAHPVLGGKAVKLINSIKRWPGRAASPRFDCGRGLLHARAPSVTTGR